MSLIRDDPTEGVLVLRSHLEEWQAMLDRVHGHLMSLDLADGYRGGKAAPTFSKLTNTVRNHSARIKGYLADEQLP